MFKKILTVVISSFVVTSAIAAQDFAECQQFFANGQIPVMPHEKQFRTRALCFSTFAVLHSGISRTPVYVAERLNRESLSEAKDNQRTDKFYAEARLPRSERADMDDYKGSGFDRGHMAPAGDMETPEAMAQSFSLANMVPQAPVNNRKAWAGIEKATRKYVMRASGDVFVVTGPIFNARPDTIGANKVWIPNYLFKLVYDPATGRAWAHWLENTDEARPGKPISYGELVERTGIDFITGLR
ncbi:MAG: DNA/RNA non-specific endonuclease [Undibacterium sp.]|nr:DNA/RNA non-specific endonuclease [Undibacterium sp.]